MGPGIVGSDSDAESGDSAYSTTATLPFSPVPENAYALAEIQGAAGDLELVLVDPAMNPVGLAVMDFEAGEGLRGERCIRQMIPHAPARIINGADFDSVLTLPTAVGLRAIPFL